MLASSLCKFQTIEKTQYDTDNLDNSLEIDSLSNLLLVYICKGAASVDTKTRKIDIKKGGLMIINPQTQATVTFQRKTEWIVLTLEGVVIISSHYTTAGQSIFYSSPPNEFIKEYLELMLFEDSQYFQGTSAIQKRLAVSILHRILMEKNVNLKANSPLRNQKEVEKVIDYLLSNYDQKINLDGLSKEFGMSKYYLIKLFRQSTAYTPIEYLIQIRVNEAERLLRETTLTISEVCLQVGFRTQSYFSKVFKKYTGYKPVNYRRKFSGS